MAGKTRDRVTAEMEYASHFDKNELTPGGRLGQNPGSSPQLFLPVYRSLDTDHDPDRGGEFPTDEYVDRLGGNVLARRTRVRLASAKAINITIPLISPSRSRQGSSSAPAPAHTVLFCK